MIVMIDIDKENLKGLGECFPELEEYFNEIYKADNLEKYQTRLSEIINEILRSEL